MSVDPSSPVAIAVAPNGGRRGKGDHPGIPLTADELASTAAACAEAGASMIHVHVRDRDGRHLLDAGAYREAIAAIRAAAGERLVIQITTESVGIYRPEAQMAVVREVRPEAVSLALAELVPDAEHEAPFADFCAWMKREAILPQIILYSPQEALRLKELERRGLVPFDRLPVLYVLGRYTTGQRSEPQDLLPFLAPDQPRFAGPWSLCAFGPQELPCVVTAALLGGHIRVGFENNFHLPNGNVAPDNATLVGATAAALRSCGRAIADARDLREML